MSCTNYECLMKYLISCSMKNNWWLVRWLWHNWLIKFPESYIGRKWLSFLRCHEWTSFIYSDDSGHTILKLFLGKKKRLKSGNFFFMKDYQILTQTSCVHVYLLFSNSNLLPDWNFHSYFIIKHTGTNHSTCAWGMPFHQCQSLCHCSIGHSLASMSKVKVQ